MRGDPHVLKAQRLQGLEAEHVTDDRRGEVADGAFLEQIEVVGDVGEPLVGRAGNLLHLVCLGAVILAIGQAVGPHHGPGRGRALAGDGGGGLHGIDAILRRQAEHGEDVGVLRLVFRLPVAHLAILEHAGGVTLLEVGDLHIKRFVHKLPPSRTVQGVPVGCTIADGLHKEKQNTLEKYISDRLPSWCVT